MQCHSRSQRQYAPKVSVGVLRIAWTAAACTARLTVTRACAFPSSNSYLQSAFNFVAPMMTSMLQTVSATIGITHLPASCLPTPGRSCAVADNQYCGVLHDPKRRR
jgi:hypothetical protein